ARGAAEVVDLDAGVVRDRHLPGGLGQGPGLDEGVLLEGVAGLVGAGLLADDLEVGTEDGLHLLDLVGVAGGEEQPHPRGAGGSARQASCIAMSSWMPFWARSSMVSSSARL